MDRTDGFTSTSREVNAVPLTSGIKTYTTPVGYTNVDGVNSTQMFTITAN